MSAKKFTKLFKSILESTLWVQQPHHIRVVWITMLAMSDADGFVASSIPGLAARSRVTIEECEEALAIFLSPDKYSRTPANEGRRVEAVMGGWVLLNYEAHWKAIDDESERERKREYMRDRRAQGVPPSSPQNATVAESSDVASISRSPSESGSDPDPGAPVVPAAKAPRRPHRLPEDFAPNESCIRLAREQGVNLANELPQFVDHYTASGVAGLDWQAKFRTWIRNAAKWGPRKQLPGAHPVDRAIQRGVTELERIRAREAEEERRMT